MKSCAEITKLLSESQDRSLLFTEAFEARAHLMMCRGCRTYKKQVQFLREIVRGYTGGRADKKNPDTSGPDSRI